MATPTKKELAETAIRLFGNIDQADQFSINDLFLHCDKKFLVKTIYDLLETIEENDGKYVADTAYIEEFVADAKKVLSRVPAEMKPIWEV